MDHNELLALLDLLSHGPWSQERDMLALGLLLGFFSKEGYGEVVRAFLACTQLQHGEVSDGD